MKRHHQLLQQTVKFMDETVLDMADSLYPFQYNSDERCHVTENQELRPLFVRLNNNYNDWERARTAFITGDYSVNPLKVMEDYRKTFAKFNRAFTIIGFAEDFPEHHARMIGATTHLLGAIELMRLVYGKK